MVAAGSIILAATTAGLADTARIVAFGDSLMAGYQLSAGEDFPARLQDSLRERGFDVAIANAAVSGDTTSGGLDRLQWSVPDDTELVLLELGANDALRGVDPAVTRANLEAMIEQLAGRGIDIILAGMLAPPNMGPDYGERFNSIYQDLARANDLPLDPFFLDGAITNPELMLEDGIHPNADGVDVMVKRFEPLVVEWLTANGHDPQ